MTRATWTLIVAALVVAVSAFAIGRATAPSQAPAAHGGSYAAGYRAGREDAFSGFDGGWALGAPYIVTLRRGPAGITYRFARRVPMTPGVAYRVCGRAVCTARP